MKTKEKKDSRKVLFVRIPHNLYKRLEKEAKNKGFQTKQAYVIHMLNKELNKN